jgi:mono/diheme cytochrome c family protein
MKTRALLLLLAIAFVASAQEIKSVPIKYTNPASGSEMYAAYCAVCHGATAKGDGPAAPAFKKLPTDLTMLARNNGGKYPDAQVKTVLGYGTKITAHGDIHMPFWKPLFHSLNRNETSDPDPETTLRIHNLVDYIKSIQAK